MTVGELIARVQQLGTIREKLHRLEATERLLSDEVRAGLQRRKSGRVQSADWLACLAERTTLELDVAKLQRKATPEVFIACVTPNVKAARRHFTEAALKKMGRATTTTQLRVSRRPKGSG